VNLHSVSNVFRQLDSISELSDDTQLLVEFCFLLIQCCDHGADVADCEGVEVGSNHHPDEGQEVFSGSLNGEVTIAHCSDGLECPIKTQEVLIQRWFVNCISRADPSVVQIILKSSCKKPCTCHQMNQKELNRQSFEQSAHSNTNIELLHPLIEFSLLSN